MKEFINKKENQIFIFLGVFALSLFVIGVCFDSINNILDGMKVIFTHNCPLLTDYWQLVGVGASFVNSGLMVSLGLLLHYIFKSECKGLTIACLFICAGYSFFGKNIFTASVIILGGILNCLVTKKKFKDYVDIMMFASCMGPILSEILYHTDLGEIRILLLFLAGLGIGFMVPALAPVAKDIHKGYDLYNIGAVSGLITLLVYSIFYMFKFNVDRSVSYYDETHDNFGYIWLLVLCGVFVLFGLFVKKDNYKKILPMTMQSGKQPFDYVDKYGIGGTLINMGLVGILIILFETLIGIKMSGPIAGATITVIGFAAIGDNPRNVLYILLGSTIGHLLGWWNLVDTHALWTGTLFCTCVATLGGEQGPFIGILTAIIHMFIVNNINSVLGGLTLYANGFVGMFDCILILPLVKLMRENKVLRYLLVKNPRE